MSIKDARHYEQMTLWTSQHIKIFASTSMLIEIHKHRFADSLFVGNLWNRFVT